jgi:hypothetical protein
MALACRGPAAHAPANEPSHAAQPQWQDAIDPAPKLLLMFRPKALRADQVYGPLLRRVLELARQRHATSGALVLDAIEDADQVIVQLDGDLPTSAEQAEPTVHELVLVLLGTRADIDPAKLVGPDGDLLWSAGPNGAVTELVHEKDHDGTPNPSSLFELSNRTWVVASGPARERCREAFARPLLHAPPSFASDALATLRIDGPSLVERVSLIGPSGPLAPLGHGLSSVVLEVLAAADLPPEGAPRKADRIPERDMRARITYSDARAAGQAATTLRGISAALGRAKPAGLGWLGDVKITEEGSSAVLTSPVPTQVLGGILRAGWSAGRPQPNGAP